MRNSRRSTFIIALFSLLAIVALIAGCAPSATPQPATEAPQAPTGGMPDLQGRTITVAVENAYPPFNKIDETTSKGVGWDYDTVTEICKRLNCTPDFKQAAWDGIFPAMQAGEFDMLADGVTITDERKENCRFLYALHNRRSGPPGQSR